MVMGKFLVSALNEESLLCFVIMLGHYINTSHVGKFDLLS